jgi:hypothetical protein
MGKYGKIMGKLGENNGKNMRNYVDYGKLSFR